MFTWRGHDDPRLDDASNDAGRPEPEVEKRGPGEPGALRAARGTDDYPIEFEIEWRGCPEREW